MTERERRAFNKGVEAAAKIADLWADECSRMAIDTIKADPLIQLARARRGPRPAQPHEIASIERAAAQSKRLAEEGHEASIRHHVAKDMATMIRDLKVTTA